MKRYPRHVRRKTAKGREYLYFDTGQRNERGQPVLTRLPSIRDADFGRAYAAADSARKRRGNVPHQLTVTMLADAFEKSPRYREFADKTRDIYSLYLGQIRARLGIAVAAELTPRDVVHVRDEMGDRPGAANQFIRTLGALYKWGRKNQRVTNNPVKDVDLYEQGEHDPWPDALVDQALESGDATVRLAVGLLYFTAQRIGDVCQLRWTDIRDGAVHVKQEKTGTELVIPIHSRLQATLDATPKTAFTILLRDGAPWHPPLLRRYLQRWASPTKVVAHGLRKNAVNALLEAGCSVAETAAISGQSLRMVEHYAKKRNRKTLATAAIHRWEAKNK